MKIGRSNFPTKYEILLISRGHRNRKICRYTICSFQLLLNTKQIVSGNLKRKTRISRTFLQKYKKILFEITNIFSVTRKAKRLN